MSQFVTADGRVFVEQGRESYVRLDGSQTELRCWAGRCRQCDAPFVVKTPASVAPEKSKSFGRVHCDEHKGLPKYFGNPARRRTP